MLFDNSHKSLSFHEHYTSYEQIFIKPATLLKQIRDVERCPDFNIMMVQKDADGNIDPDNKVQLSDIPDLLTVPYPYKAPVDASMATVYSKLTKEERDKYIPILIEDWNTKIFKRVMPLINHAVDINKIKEFDADKRYGMIISYNTGRTFTFAPYSTGAYDNFSMISLNALIYTYAASKNDKNLSLIMKTASKYCGDKYLYTFVFENSKNPSDYIASLPLAEDIGGNLTLDQIEHVAGYVEERFRAGDRYIITV